MWKVTCEGLELLVPYTDIANRIAQTPVANRKRIHSTEFVLGAWHVVKVV